MTEGKIVGTVKERLMDLKNDQKNLNFFIWYCLCLPVTLH